MPENDVAAPERIAAPASSAESVVEDPEPTLTRPARIAVVHYWVRSVRGGEKVFFELARAFPSADLFVLHGDPSLLPDDLVERGFTQSFLRRWPLRAVSHHALLPLLPRAARSLDLTGYDLVISSSTGWSHGVRMNASACHVSYVHSPPRYLWGESSPIGGETLTSLLSPVLRRLRNWDARAAGSVDAFVANSAATALKVADCYKREAVVVHPPVEADGFRPLRPLAKHDFAVAAGELVRYKRFDLAIEACALERIPLIVIGEGPERRRLGALADELEADIRFTGRVTDAELHRLMAQARVFIHAGVEDFGITTVEALAAGTPVVGARGGGTGEIVTPQTGRLVDVQSPAGFAEALRDAWNTSFERGALIRRAQEFGPEAFRESMRTIVAEEFEKTQVLGPRPATARRAHRRPLRYARRPPSRLALAAKRLLDVVGSIVALVVLAPLFLVVALAVTATMGRPVLYGHRRVGRNGEPFRMIKFRTMRPDADNVLREDPEMFALYQQNDYKLPAELDPRVTRLGRFLRRFSVDELPQFLNVLRGHMSLVGPRPVERAQLDQYGDYLPHYLDVRPGLTGAWQTGGRSEIVFPERAEIDAAYVENWSFWADVRLLAKTIPAVFRQDGAH